MDCLMTYSDDYLHRDGGSFYIKSNKIMDPHVLYNEVLCGCGIKLTEKLPVIAAESLKTDSYEWSRLGPMGYLVEPKLNPINVFSTPDVATKNLIDIKKWQKKIDSKYCQPLNIVPISHVSPVDILQHINDDRLRSTYQTDFGHMDDYPWADYDDLNVSSDKTFHILKKPHDVVKCRERPKPPYLNGHEIPGRHLKETGHFGLFGSKNSNKKLRSTGSEGTNHPLRSVRLRRTSQQSKNITDEIDVIPRILIDNQTDQNEILENMARDERRQIRNTSENERDSHDGKSRQTFPSLTGDGRNISNEKSRQIMRSATGDVRDIKTDKKTISNNQQLSIIDEKISDPKRNLSAKKDNKEVGKINKETRNTRKNNAVNLGKPRKDNSEELQLTSSMPWTSEYQDIISRTADDIMKTKLHYYGKLRLNTPNPDCP